MVRVKIYIYIRMSHVYVYKYTNLRVTWFLGPPWFLAFPRDYGCGPWAMRASPGVGRLFSLTRISLLLTVFLQEYFPLPPQGTGVAKRIGTVIRELAKGGGLIDGRCA